MFISSINIWNGNKYFQTYHGFMKLTVNYFVNHSVVKDIYLYQIFVWMGRFLVKTHNSTSCFTNMIKRWFSKNAAINFPDIGDRSLGRLTVAASPQNSVDAPIIDPIPSATPNSSPSNRQMPSGRTTTSIVINNIFNG